MIEYQIKFMIYKSVSDMNYEIETLAATLKVAREKRGLSQRDLSARTGVPQSHISKIETGGVDLRISSLTAIANALDLEIALVPRKAVPAVKSLSRSIDVTPLVLPDVAKQMATIAKRLSNIETLNIDTDALSEVQRRFKEMQQFQNLIPDSSEVQRISETIKAVTDSDGIKALQEAGKQMAHIRNALAHAHVDIKPSNLPRAAYQLDGDDNG